jgi:hypothetical protein
MLEEVKKKKKLARAFDSCVIEMPRQFAIANGLPPRSFVSLTLQNGRLKSEIVEHNDTDEKEVEEFLTAFPDFNEEMQRVGD